MTIEEIAEYLKLPVDSLYKYARNGKIPAFKVGRYWRFDRDQIDQWVRNQRKDLQIELQVLLIIEDEVRRDLLADWGQQQGCTTDQASDGETGLGYMSIQQYTAVFIDLEIAAEGGLDILHRMSKLAENTEIILLTDQMEQGLMSEALEMAHFTLLKRPVKESDFQKIIRELVPVRPQYQR